MKIVELKSSNIKRLKAVELHLDDNKNLVVISGKNAQGKSSILDSIWYALGGKKAVPGKPIREGEEKAEIELNLEGYIVKRTFTSKGSYLVVTNKEGAPYSNPQAFLDYIINNLAFDPLEFTKLESRKQVDTLAKTVGLDITEFDNKKKELTAERVGIGREIKAVSKYTTEQIEQAQKDLEANKNLPSLQQAIDTYQQASKELQEYDSIQVEISRIEDDIKQLQAQLSGLKEVKKPLHDLAKLKTDMDSLQERSDKYKNAERILADNKVVAEKQAIYDKLTADLVSIDEKKATKLSEAKMPIDGLSWTEESVLYNSIPFEQISAAEQLRVSMAIAMATNPKLKVILIRDGSLLDSDNLAVIDEMAKDNDWQVWVERVDDSGKIGIYIEEGEVKSINE